MSIYTIRTTSGREDVVIDMLESNVKVEKTDVKSIFHPAEIKGYIFVEGGLGAIQKSMHGLMHAKGLIEKPVQLEEIRHFLEQKKAIIRVSGGDTVEIIGGPFRGERGEIKRIDKVKDEVTIELLEASIPIPVTIATEFIKIVKKAKGEEIQREAPRPEPMPEPEEEDSEETEKTDEEASAFDFKALRERKEARDIKEGIKEPGEKPGSSPEPQEDKPKPLPDELKKDMGDNPEPSLKPEETAEIKQPNESVEPEESQDDELKGGILEELEREEKEKKKKRLEDLEDLE